MSIDELELIQTTNLFYDFHTSMTIFDKNVDQLAVIVARDKEKNASLLCFVSQTNVSDGLMNVRAYLTNGYNFTHPVPCLLTEHDVAVLKAVWNTDRVSIYKTDFLYVMKGDYHYETNLISGTIVD